MAPASQAAADPGSTSVGRGPGWARRLVIVLASALGALLVAELFLRGCGPESGSYFVREPGRSEHFRPKPGLMPGIEGESRFLTSSAGLRADELDPAFDFHVLAIGGSTTECLYLDQSETWPAVLQRLLNAAPSEHRSWVGNAGVSGRTLRVNVVQLPFLLDQLADLDVVLVLVGVNDLMLRLSSGAAYDPDFMQRDDAEERLLARAFEVLPVDRASEEAVWKRTALWRLAKRGRDKLFASRQVQDEAGASYELWRRNRREASAWIDELPELDAALAEQERNLRRVIELCRDAGARPVLLTHPAMWAEELRPAVERLLWMGWVGESQSRPGQPYYTARALAEGLERYNALVRDLAATASVELVELALPMNRDATFYYDDVHFNEAGALRAGQILAEHLLAQPPFR